MVSSYDYTPGELPGSQAERRMLFLDDDPERAKAFLEKNPTAVWVQTVEDCLKRLEENWDEVHLDHDLGGERYVRVDREDCGMEVVRWLCLVQHPHLMPTRFFIHSHNENAASIMLSQMRIAGFRVSFRPFGTEEAAPRFSDKGEGRGWRRRGFRQWLRDVFARINKEAYGTLADEEKFRR